MTCTITFQEQNKTCTGNSGPASFTSMTMIPGFNCESCHTMARSSHDTFHGQLLLCVLCCFKGTLHSHFIDSSSNSAPGLEHFECKHILCPPWSKTICANIHLHTPSGWSMIPSSKEDHTAEQWNIPGNYFTRPQHKKKRSTATKRHFLTLHQTCDSSNSIKAQVTGCTKRS